jgi:hypothetical protein
MKKNSKKYAWLVFWKTPCTKWTLDDYFTSEKRAEQYIEKDSKNFPTLKYNIIKRQKVKERINK